MIKSIPEDFIVEEKADLPLREKGSYRVYLLRKKNWNTLDLIHFLAKSLSLPSRKFSYGGKKDKHGLTSQFITIKDRRDYTRQGEDFSIESKGFMLRPMSPDLIKGNFFRVTTRNLEDFETIERNIEEVETFGFPNFFDDQRFRSYSPEKGFFAEKILKQHWNDALQVYLTSISTNKKRKERERKDGIFKNWRDWKTCLSYAKYPVEKRIFRFLKDYPKDLARALDWIPEEEVSMLYSAFQSHLWNELLRRFVQQKAKKLEEVKGIEGSYLFWRKLDKEAFLYLSDLELPTASAKMQFPDSPTQSLYEEILKEKELKYSSFRTKVLSKVYFKSFLRKAVIIPDDIKIIDKAEDELHATKKKMTLSFFLPRGSYATMLMKRLSLVP